MLKKIVPLIVSLTVGISSACFSEAYRIDDRNNEKPRELQTDKTVFLDDYTDMAVGAAPPGYRLINTHAGTVTVKEYEVKLPNGKTVKKNCLEVDDNVSDSVGSKRYAGPGFSRSFKEVKGKYAVEARMMFVEESNPYSALQLCSRNGNDNITRLLQGSATGSLGTASTVGEIANIGKFQPGVWYTFKFMIDLTNDVSQLKVTAEEIGVETIYTDLGLYDEKAKSAEAVNSVYFDMQVYDGKTVFDYIKVERSPYFYDGTKIAFVHPENLIIPPVTNAPSNRPVPGKVNLCINGEYVYPATPLYINNGVTMIYIKNFAALFGAEYSEDGRLILSGKEINVKGEVKDGKLFIPIRIAAEAIGLKVGWDSSAEAVLLEGEIQ